MKQSCYIFDLDHTLCHPVNRWPYSSCAEDEAIPSVKLIAEFIAYRNSDKYRQYMKTRVHIIILSWRKEWDHKFETIKWLDENKIIYEEIHLNNSNPCTKAEVFKREKLIELQEKYNILWVFDDDPLVAEICKELKIPNFLFSYNYV